jgi:anti-sigma-K factor RskA
MSGPSDLLRQPFDCREVDALDAAYILGALETDEVRAVQEHLATCPQPHAGLRGLMGIEQVLAMGLEPVAPSPDLRDRLMATIARTPQDWAAAPSVAAPVSVRVPERPVEASPRRGWLDWLSPQVARPLAIAAVVALVAVGAWGLNAQTQLAARDRALRDVAEAIAGGEVAFRVSGDAGRGYVVETPGAGAAFVVADVASLEANQLYELWLINDGGPVAVGTFRPAPEAVAVIPVELDLEGYSTFAVTVEEGRVDTPTSEPVMVAPLEAT